MFCVGDIIRGVKGSNYGITNEYAEMRVLGAHTGSLHVLVLKIDSGHPQNCVGRTFSGLSPSLFEHSLRHGELYLGTTYDLEEGLDEEDKEIIKKELNLITT